MQAGNPLFPLPDDSFLHLFKKKPQKQTASPIFLQALNSNVDETWLFFNPCKTNRFHLETIYTSRPHPAWPQSQAVLVQLENPISFYEQGHLGVPQNLISLHGSSHPSLVRDPKRRACSGQRDEPSPPHPQRPQLSLLSHISFQKDHQSLAELSITKPSKALKFSFRGNRVPQPRLPAINPPTEASGKRCRAAR